MALYSEHQTPATSRVFLLANDRCCVCVEALPPNQAAPLWRNVYERAAAVIVSA